MASRRIRARLTIVAQGVGIYSRHRRSWDIPLLLRDAFLRATFKTGRTKFNAAPRLGKVRHSVS
jgi:hypothetical protein